LAFSLRLAARRGLAVCSTPWSRRPLVQLGQELPAPKGIDPDREDSLL
jgi:hypothetical protein